MEHRRGVQPTALKGVVRMRVQVPSIYSGRLNEMDLPVTSEQLARWHKEGEAILVAMPNLTADEVQFLITGTTPQERIARFGPLAR